MLSDTVNTTNTVSPSEMMKRKTKRVTLEMEHDQHKRLRQACLEEDRTMREFITQAVNELMERRGY